MSAEKNNQQDDALVLELGEAVPQLSDAEKTATLARAARIRTRVAVGDAIMTEGGK
jgi:hypothetical protein